MTDKTILFITPEMLIEELGQPACDANSRGGLGIFGSDCCEGFSRLGYNFIGCVPFFHRHWLSGKKIRYEKTSAVPLGSLEPHSKLRPVNIFKIQRAKINIFGIQQDIINDVLYTGDRWKRLQQHVTLGHTVPALIKKQKIKPDVVWINEGHASIAIPVMLEDSYFKGIKVLFTTHTPVEAGMEKFEIDFKELRIHEKYRDIFMHNGMIDLTWGAMTLANSINSVSGEHGEKTREMFPKFAHKVTSVTNGSGRNFWMSPRLRAVENSMDLQKLADAHEVDKVELIDLIFKKTGVYLDPHKPTLCWVRRLAAYKRQYPMLASIIDAVCADRNTYVNTPFGKLRGCGFQHIGAGVAHESDQERREWANHFYSWSIGKLKGKFVFLSDYSLDLLRRVCWGSDVWFSCPRKREEACGTSEERAQINGIPDITTCGGGAAEYIEDFDIVTGQGNGLFIEPDEPIHLYYKLREFSDLYYDWKVNGNDRWLRLKMNAFNTGKTLDSVFMAKKYGEIFEKMLAI